jgi:hypothetical protein
MADTDLSRLVTEFSARIVSFVESTTRERIQTVLAGAFPVGKRGPGRPPKNALLEGPVPLALGVPRKKAPKQLCPVPGCKNPAAPVFGMVCSDHKNVPKAKIKKYREARKAAKGGPKARGKAKVKVAAKRRSTKVTRQSKPKAAYRRKAPAKPVLQPQPTPETTAP